MTKPIPTEWIRSLGLSERGPPDFYITGDNLAGARYAAAMRQSFDLDLLGVSGFFCVQEAPAVAFLVLDEYDDAPRRINEAHKALWNQGLANLLCVIQDNVITAYSLARKPRKVMPTDVDPRRIEVLHLVRQALEVRNLLSGIESGRYIAEHVEYFDPKERIDRVLLDNLIETHRELTRKGLDTDAAQALLMQCMFIAYLQDREIIKASYYQEATGNQSLNSFQTLLQTGQPSLLNRLFQSLREHFNGDLFFSPCTFTADAPSCPLAREHLQLLADFLWGDRELTTGQHRFWSYDFRFIPVELISTVYDRFLSLDPGRKKAEGAYYTPMFLADLVVDQALERLGLRDLDDVTMLDPACGSGVFLVRMFERLAEAARQQQGSARLPWPYLKELASPLQQ